MEGLCTGGEYNGKILLLFNIMAFPLVVVQKSCVS